MRTGQTRRILDYLLAHPGQEISALELHHAGSGSPYGFCASISRRISDLRKLGYDVQLSRDVMHNGQRFTWYCLVETKAQAQTQARD